MYTARCKSYVIHLHYNITWSEPIYGAFFYENHVACMPVSNIQKHEYLEIRKIWNCLQKFSKAYIDLLLYSGRVGWRNTFVYFQRDVLKYSIVSLNARTT